jgi:mannobiose 2-epimerase
VPLATRIHRPLRIVRSVLDGTVDALAAALGPPALDKAALRDVPIVEQIETVLRQDMLGNWFPRVVDEKGGGYFENFDRAWRPSGDTSKSLIYHCRVTWAAAAFARHAPEHASTFGAYAAHGVEFIARRLRDAKHGSFFFSIDTEGSPFRDGEKHALVSAYTIFAFAAAYAATGQQRALELAREEFAWLEAHAHDDRGGYHEALRRDGTPILARDTPPGRDLLWRRYGSKTLSTQIHLLEALSGLFAVSHEAIVQERVQELHALALKRVITSDGDLLAVCDEQHDEPAELASGGYMMETASFLIEALPALDERHEQPTWQIARRLVDRTLERHWDTRFGGVYVNPSGAISAETKVGKVARPSDGEIAKDWWAQAEALRALALMDARFGETTEGYRQAFEGQWRFIFEHFIDGRYGGWYRRTDAAGHVMGTRSKAWAWQACYHTGRTLMEVSALLRS